MDRAFDDILHEALALDRESKVQLAERLAIDLSMDEGHKTAWVEESNRRFEAYKRGEIEAVDATEATARIRSRIFKK
ncbi:MAG TPA: addiction module protein [Candidatus Kapabacteria bacterium]|nr:addiction module protein [Candidatus Kapabacteria bacterium]